MLNTEQVIKEIKSEHKWYIGVLPKSTAYYYIRAIRSGHISLNKMREFFASFGYTEVESQKWTKK